MELKGRQAEKNAGCGLEGNNKEVNRQAKH